MNMTVYLFPGQGSQHKGMGKELFPTYSDEVKRCSEILGYSIEELCLENPGGKLKQTAFSQPAIFFVSALTYLEHVKSNPIPRWMLGHSLGEITALFAAGAFDLETGIRLVQKRGELMAKVSGGSMAAILGLEKKEVEELLRQNGFSGIDIANHNAPTQIVVSGPENEIGSFVSFCDEREIKAIPLYVSGAFHSRYMKEVEEAFADYLKGVTFNSLKKEVIANATGAPYTDHEIASLLTRQFSSPVLWVDSIQTVLNQGGEHFVEMGSEILSKMVAQIQESHRPISKPNQTTSLGPDAFRRELGVFHNYVTGSMYRGIASKDLVVRMAKAGFLSFFGAGGLSLDIVEEAIDAILAEVGSAPFGVNLLCDYQDSDGEMRFVDCLLEKGVKIIEAAAFVRMTPALVKFAIKGLYRDPKTGKIKSRHKTFGKISSVEMGERFLSPIPDGMIEQLLKEGQITDEEALLAKGMPVCRFLTVEADSGGHTDRRSLITLLPSILKLKERFSSEEHPIFVGAAGGVGTPDVIATAFMMGADYVLTGSINHCTVESGTSDKVKSLLQEIGITDTAYAPAGDMFEMGSKVQVLKKGVLFPVKANKLYQIYSLVRSLDEIPDYLLENLESKYFRKSAEEIYQECLDFFRQVGLEREIEKAERDPKHKMALVFRWYLGLSNTWAITGDPDRVVDYQIHIGPALGAFNAHVRGTPMQNWKNRHVDEIAKFLLDEAADHLKHIQQRVFIS